MLLFENRRQTSTSRLNQEGFDMNHDQIAGNWKQFKGKVQEQWGKIRHDAFDAAYGRQEQLLGRIQKLQGASRQESKNDLAQWERLNSDLQCGISRSR